MTNKLEEFRNLYGITREQLANEVGISTEYLTEIERGTRVPELDVADKISNYFKVSLYWMFDLLTDYDSQYGLYM